MRIDERPLPRRRFLGIVGGAAGLAMAGSLEPFLRTGDARASTTFPLDGATATRILNEARSRGAPFSELFLETRTVTNVSLSDGEIESVEQGIFAGAGVRAVDGERTGYAYADSFEAEDLIEAARNASAIASHPVAGLQGIIYQVERPARRIRYLHPFDEVPQDERVGWLTRIDAAARAYDPAIKQVTIEHSDEMLHFAVINSDGLWIEDTLPLLYTRTNVVAEKNGSTGTGFGRISHRLGAEQMDGDVPENSGKEAARMAMVGIDAEPAPTGEMPVVLAAGGGVLFHEAVGHGLEGDFARKGTSVYTGRVGEVVASNRVSVIDHGGIADLRGSFNVDDEGTPPRMNILIERGVLQGFMTDRITAQALDTRRSGNGRRQSYRHPPMVRMSNTFLYQGEDDVEQMIRETKNGLYAVALGGGEVDTTTGNFTFGLREAYRIEDGKVGAPVRGAVLVGNGPEIMKRIDRVGPDLEFWVGTCGKGQWVPVTSGAPTLRISSMTVGGQDQG
ncbi:MAG: metalloprotease TldD [Candidatus Eisenbacteria bacterium]|nr:metalloprotease TldD [Candidatus Latescibacterota bacterium]MBD3302867.1 metalloprotease TldD [Candidatus Eisenbacteria bacterium]